MAFICALDRSRAGACPLSESEGGKGCSKWRSLQVSALVLASCLVLISGTDAVSTLPSGMENPLVIRYPLLNTAPAPAWVTEGLRVTYDVIASTSDVEHGESVDWRSGSSGAGISQIDVVALEDGLAATMTFPYVPDTMGAMRQKIGFGSTVPAGCGDFWCSPEVLAGIADQAADDLTVQRVPFQANGATYQAIRFDYRSESLQMALVYDLNSGLMLYHTVDYSSYTSESGKIQSSWGNHAIYQFRNMRRQNIPWIHGSAPAWALPGTALNYQGQTDILLPGTPTSSYPFSIRLSFLVAHERFSEVREDTYNQDPVPPPVIMQVSGVAQLMGNWVPAEAREAGTGLIDSDPDTGMLVTIVQNDDSGLVLERSNQFNFQEQFTYDSDGKLVQIYQEFNPDIATVTNFNSVKKVLARLVE